MPHIQREHLSKHAMEVLQAITRSGDWQIEVSLRRRSHDQRRDPRRAWVYLEDPRIADYPHTLRVRLATLDHLYKRGLIERTYTRSGEVPFERYGITEQGRQVLRRSIERQRDDRAA